MAATCTGVLVTPGEVGQLVENLNDVAGKWELFLSQLKVPKSKRDQIKLQRANHPNHAQLCLLDGLEHWVACDDSPTYEKIISTLRSEVVNNPAAAQKIKEMHLIKDSNEEEDQEISDFPLSITVTPEHLLHIFKEGKTCEKTDGVLALLKGTDRPVKTITDEDDKTLLHLACHNNWVQWLSIAKTLVDVYFCYPSAQDRYGNTPLHDACKYDNRNLAKYLLSLDSCDPNIKNAAMESALYIARESPDMVRIVLASGLVENDVVDKVVRFITMSDVADPLSSKNDVEKLLEDYTRCVQKYDPPTMPFPHKTCCVLLDLLEGTLLRNKTKCRIEDIVTFSKENGLPMPSDSKSICELLSDIGEHKLYKFIQKSLPESSVLEKRPPGYRLEEDHEVTSQDLVISLLQPEVDAREHSSLRMQCTEMKTLQHTNSGSVYETVQREHHQAAGSLSVTSFQQRTQESWDKNTVADNTGNTTSSCSPPPEQNDGIDNKNDSATVPDNTEPLVEQQPDESTDSDESSFDEPKDTVRVFSDDDAEYKHGGDFEPDDVSSIRSDGSCRKTASKREHSLELMVQKVEAQVQIEYERRREAEESICHLQELADTCERREQAAIASAAAREEQYERKLHVIQLSLDDATARVQQLERQGLGPKRRQTATDNKKLIKACKKGDEDRVRALLERGADIQAREDNELQWTPLMCAILKNRFGTVQLLLSQPLSDLMIDVQDAKGRTAFVVACNRGNLGMVKLLQHHGANIHHQDHEGWNGLMWAASKKGNLALAKYLLASGANTELRDNLDWTPLMIASQTLSDKNIVQELLMYDADPRARNKDGMTPLHIATNDN